MIFGVIATLLIYRGAQVNTGTSRTASPGGRSPHGPWARRFSGFGHAANGHIETVFILAQLAVIWGFFVFVLHSKHLHIFVSEPNVLFSRRPKALGPLGTTPDLDPEKMTEDTVSVPAISPTSPGSSARPHQLHRVRPLPGPVPGLGYRQAAVAEVAHHGPARPPDGRRARVARGGESQGQRGR
jgi:hypothetical protein